MPTLLIVGCGTLGSSVAELRIHAGDRVLGLTRHPRELPNGTVPLLGDVTKPECFANIMESVDHVVYCVGPSGRDVSAYRSVFDLGLSNLLDWLIATSRRKSRLLFVSSTSVYGQTDGQWVDEQSETSPRDATAQVLLEAEQRVLSICPNSVVLRLAGIYGPSRKSLVERAAAGLLPGQLGDHFVNRMYLLDCARAVEHLLHLDAAERLFIGADDEPASQRTVLTWLSEHFDLPPVPARDPVQHCAPNHKRCRNTQLCQSGFYLKYPTFRQGYTELAHAAGLLPRKR